MGRSDKRGLARDLGRLVNKARVRTDPEDLYVYTGDAAYDYCPRGMPDAVILPETREEVSRVLKYAYDHNLPVTPRGAGTGLAGGCVPIQGGIVLDMRRMSRIMEIDKRNTVARVESGTVLACFQNTVEREKLFYPPDPQSGDVCTLGGNVSTRAGGPRGVKYGSTGDYVLGLELVLPDGSVIRTGGSCTKQSVGYDLTHLLAGAEGTLGVITEIDLRLLPLPPSSRTAVLVCETVDQTAKMVSEIIASGTVPAKIEFLVSGAVFLMNTMISPPLNVEGESCLLIELDGSPTQVEEDTLALKRVGAEMGALEIRVVEDEQEASGYWKARSNLRAMSLKLVHRVITEDVSVPRDRIPALLRSVEEITSSLASMGMMSGIGGHAGDGNMHPSIVFAAEPTEEMLQKGRTAIKEIVKAGLDLGGTISGEHGIGLLKSEFLEWELGKVQVALLKRIKQAFDPKGIMNPGKIWK